MIEMIEVMWNKVRYWKPSCEECGWQDEPHKQKLFAHIAAGKHMKEIHYAEKEREI